MNSNFKIKIPKPCHENWSTMTPKEKGRFCSSCSKTVIDFTKKSTLEIKEYLVENKNNRICGHFYKKQLDSITIEIPQITFQKQLSFEKIFVLALFFVMGTTLFSCQYTNGKKQKIENVIIIDTIKTIKNEIDSLTIFNSKNSSPVWVSVCPSEKTILKNGDIINTNEEIEISVGIIDTNYEPEEIGFIIIEEPPRFKPSKKLSNEEARKDFDQQLKKFIKENFNFEIAQNLGLRKGKHKIFFLIIIDEVGKVSEIKVRAPHPTLKKEVIKTLQKLPQFIPGKQNGKVVKTKYTFPITFMVK